MNTAKMRRYVLGQQHEGVWYGYDDPFGKDVLIHPGSLLDRAVDTHVAITDWWEMHNEAYALNAMVKVAWAKAEGNLVEVKCETIDTTSGVHEYKTIVVCQPGDISPWEIGTFEGLSFYQAQQLASRVVLLLHGYEIADDQSLESLGDEAEQHATYTNLEPDQP